MLSLPNFGVTAIVAYTSKTGNEEKNSVSPTENTKTSNMRANTVRSARASPAAGSLDNFTVGPQFLPDPRAMARSIFLLEVRLQNKPVFFYYLKPPSQLGPLIRRQEADEQLRRRMGDLCGQCPIL